MQKTTTTKGRAMSGIKGASKGIDTGKRIKAKVVISKYIPADPFRRDDLKFRTPDGISNVGNGLMKVNRL